MQSRRSYTLSSFEDIRLKNTDHLIKTIDLVPSEGLQYQTVYNIRQFTTLDSLGPLTNIY